MKENLQRKLKFILFSSIIFYLGIIVVGIIPYYFYDEFFWDSNIFMIIVGGILGFSLIISIMSNIQVSLSIIRPYKSIINYIVIINVLLTLFVIDITFSDVIDKYELLVVALFISSGVLVIVLNTINLTTFKMIGKDELIVNWNQGVDNLPDNYKNQTGILNLNNVIIFIFISTALFDFNMDRLMDYTIIFVISGFVIYNYQKDYDLSNKKIVIESSVYIVLFILSLFVLISFNEFLEQHVVLRGLVILLPFTHIGVEVIPNAFIKMWKETNLNDVDI